MAQLQNLAFVEGVPDGGASSANLRAITWKLLLGYLPPQHANWQAHLESQRRLYTDYLSELSVDPRTPAEVAADVGGRGGVAGAPADAPAGEAAESSPDHPLAGGGKWAEWHADEDLRHEIQKDVDRCATRLY